MKDYILTYKDGFKITKIEGIAHILDNDSDMNTATIRMDERRFDFIECFDKILSIKEINY